APQPAAAAPAPKVAAPTPPPAVQPAAQAPRNDGGAKQAPPSVQRIAAEGGVDIAGLSGSGRDGRLTKSDALAVIEARAQGAQQTPQTLQSTAIAAPPRAIGPREERVPMTRLRQTVARRLKEAQNTAAMLTTFNEADMSAIMAARNKYKDTFEKRHGVKLGFMSFFVK